MRAEVLHVSSTASLLLWMRQVELQAGPLLVLLTTHTHTAIRCIYFISREWCVCVFPVLPFWVWQGVLTSLYSELVSQPFWEQQLGKQNKGWELLLSSITLIHNFIYLFNLAHKLSNKADCSLMLTLHNIPLSSNTSGFIWPSGAMLPDTLVCVLADRKQGASTDAKQSSSRCCWCLWHCSTGRAGSPPGIH